MHRSEENSFIAYAQWENKESWLSGHKIIERITIEQNIDECFTESPAVLRHLVVVDDLLAQETSAD